MATASVQNIIQCLKSTQLDSTASARRLRLLCRKADAVSPLSSTLGTTDSVSGDDEFVSNFGHGDQKGTVPSITTELALGTIGIACLQLTNDYQTHLKDVINKENVQTAAHVSLNKLIPYLFEYEIDQALKRAGIQPLRVLCQNENLVREYQGIIMSKSFDISYTTEEILGNGLAYSANLIYVYEYFTAKRVPSMITDLPVLGQNSFLDILKNWLDHTISPSEGESFANVIAKLSSDPSGTSFHLKNAKKFADDLLNLVLSVQAVFAPGVNLTDPAFTTLAKVIAKAYPHYAQFPVSRFASFEHNVQPFEHNLWLDWNNQASCWQQDLATLLSRPRTEDSVLHTSWFYGEDLKKVMVNAARPDLWEANRINDWQMTDNETVFSCFKAGTLIWTDFGKKAIELLAENDRVLTRVDPIQFGLRSSEKVETPIRDGHTLLYGINDEPAFFTPGHVFYTTTGLRAVNPESARQENPWLTVGKLKVGHVVLRTDNGNEYQRVPIQRLTKEIVECTHVYGVHLREGLRSYHANGYLVHLNYPEITVHSIADALRSFPRQKQVELLTHIKELQPVFAKFGAGTVLEVLSRELADKSLLNNSKVKVNKKRQPLPLQYQSRSFELIEFAKQGTADPAHYAIELPTVDAYDGVLFVGGEYCEYARFTERGMTWMRPVTDALWEYGMFSFGNDYQMLAGTGAVWYAHDEASANKPSHIRRAEIVSVSLRPPVSGRQRLCSMETNAVLKEAAYMTLATEPVQETTSATDTLGDGSEKLPATPPEGTRPTQDKSMLKTLQQGWTDPNLAYRFQNIYSSFYDDQSWDPNIPAVLDPNFLLDFAYYSKGGLGQIKTISFVIPALDELASVRRTKMTSGSDADLASFSYYTTAVYLTKENNLCVTFSLKDATLLIQASDQFTGQADDALPYKNLTFKNSGSDLSLPFLPQTGNFTMDATDSTASGFVREYDPTMRGNVGAHHRLNLSVADTSSADVRQEMAQGIPGYLDPGNAHQDPPASPFGSQAQVLSTDELKKLVIDSAQIKQDAQNFIQNAMLYHMDDDDRLNFFGMDVAHKPKVGDDPEDPTQVPSALADKLNKGVQTWLSKTYVPAYLALNLAKLSQDQQDSFKINYTEKDRKKLTYFWKGHDKHSMAQTDEYNELNAIATSQAILRRVPRIQDYLQDLTVIDDTSPTGKAALAKYPAWATYKGGQKWAHLLFFDLTRTDVIKSTTGAVSIASHIRENALEHDCTLLHTLYTDPNLDPSKELSLEAWLTAIVESKISADAVSGGDYVGKFQHIIPAYQDNLRELILLILEGKDELDSALHDQITQDLKEMYEWDAGVTSGQLASNAVLSDQLSRKMVDSIRDGADSLTSKWSMEKMSKMFGKNGSPANSTSVAKWASTMCLVSTLATVATFAVTAWLSWKQKPDWMDYTKLVASSLQAATGLVYGVLRARYIWQDGNLLAAETRQASVQELQMEVFHEFRPNPVEEADASVTDSFVAQSRMDAEASALLSDVPARSISNASSIPNGGNDSDDDHWSNFDWERDDEEDGYTELETQVSDTEPPQPRVPPNSIASDPDESSLTDGGAARRQLAADWDVRELQLRMFSMAASAVLLVMSCLTLAHSWSNLDFWERALGVLFLVQQFASLVVDTVMIFVSVAAWITVALAVVGAILLIAYALYEHFKPPPKTPIQIWYENTGREFVKNLADPPEPQLDWVLSPASGQCGTTPVITVTGTARGPNNPKGLPRLSGVSVGFSAATKNVGVLFNTDAPFVENDIVGSTLVTNQASVTFPADLQKTASGGLIVPNVSAGTPTWQCIVNGNMAVDNYTTGSTTPRQLLTLAKGDQIVIKFCGPIAARGGKDGDDMCKISIVETYLDERMNFQETIEPNVSFQKISSS